MAFILQVCQGYHIYIYVCVFMYIILLLVTNKTKRQVPKYYIYTWILYMNLCAGMKYTYRRRHMNSVNILILNHLRHLPRLQRRRQIFTTATSEFDNINKPMQWEFSIPDLIRYKWILLEFSFFHYYFYCSTDTAYALESHVISKNLYWNMENIYI